MILLVDVVNNDRVIPLDDLCILDAPLDFAVTLEDLEDGLDVLAIFGLAEEFEETLQLLVVLFGYFVSLFVGKAVVVAPRQNRIQLIELQLHNPGAKQKLLWLLLLLVRSLGDNLEHMFKVFDQHVELVLLQKVERYLLERLGALGIVLGCLTVSLLLEKLVCVDASNIWFLFLLAML